MPDTDAQGILALFLQALNDTLLIILMAVAVFSIIFGVTLSKDKDVDWIEGVAIFFAVFLVAIVTAVNDFQKEKQFRALREKQVRDFTVFLLHGLIWP